MPMRRVVVGVVVATLVSLLCVPAQAVEVERERSFNWAKQWAGIWLTEHQYGNPKLRLHYNDEKNTVSGTYSDNGKQLGTIAGGLSDRGRTWAGRYRDYEGGAKGKFYALLLTNADEFHGGFTPCGAVCTPLDTPIDWIGFKKTKAGSDPFD